MTTYYCDPTLDYQDASGTDTGANVLLGVGGLQAAVRGTGLATALAAGDSLHVKTGTGNLGRLIKLVCGKDVSGWSLGDEVRNDTGNGDHWTGVVCELNVGAVNTTILMELDSAYTRTVVEANKGDGIENTTTPDTTTIVSTACEGIWTGTNSGDAVSGNWKIIGVDSSWNTGNGSTDYCLTLNGQSVAAQCLTMVGSYGWLENIIFQNATGSNIHYSGGGSGWIYRYIVSELAGTHGLSSARHVAVSLMVACIFRNNTNNGATYGFGYTFFCSFYGNGGMGMQYNDVRHHFGLFSDNGGDNCDLYYVRSALIGCVIDGAGGDGVDFGSASDHKQIIACRITNNGGYGIRGSATGRETNVEDWNVFYNNTSGHRLNIATGPNSRTAANAAEAGYTDQPNGDFTLTDAAIMAGIDGEQIDLDWTGSPANPGYFTAGLPRVYAPLSFVGSRRNTLIGR